MLSVCLSVSLSLYKSTEVTSQFTPIELQDKHFIFYPEYFFGPPFLHTSFLCLLLQTHRFKDADGCCISECHYVTSTHQNFTRLHHLTVPEIKNYPPRNETNSEFTPENRGPPKRKASSSNHQYSGASAVSSGKVYLNQRLHLLW